MNVTQLACDYLVVGAGAAAIAFIDTLLTRHPSTKIVLVDKNPIPGGHWVNAYGYVRLHQPSIVYGIASRQLEGNWMKLLAGRLTLPWNHRASKDEILGYYASYIQDKVAAGQIQYFPNSMYQFPQENGDDEEEHTHCFSSMDGSRYSIQVKTKLINGVLGECIIPSLSPVNFHVDDGVQVVTPNQIFDGNQLVDSNKTNHFVVLGCGMGECIIPSLSPVNFHVDDGVQVATPNQIFDGNQLVDSQKTKHFVVLGCGKTAMDTVVFLQRDMKVGPDRISWIIPNDVWMLQRDSGSPWSWHKALLEHSNDVHEASLSLERRGIFARLDTDIEPTKFRFPVVGKDELKLMQLVKNRIRRGRVTGITKQHETGRIDVEFERDQETWTLDKTIDSADLIFVHCTSPGPFNGNENLDLFVSDHQLNLNPMFPPPIPFSMSVLAYLESARVSNNLDLTFARQLLQSSKTEHHIEERETISDNEVLRRLFACLDLQQASYGDKPYQTILNLGMFLAIGDKDPLVVYQFLKKNRLSFFSIPGSKVGVYEALGLFVERAKPFGLTANEIGSMQLLRKKLQVLEGK